MYDALLCHDSLFERLSKQTHKQSTHTHTHTLPSHPSSPPHRSISSSSAVTPSEVAVTVGRVTYNLPNGRRRDGFASTYLTSLAPGARVRFHLASQPAFRLPLNPESPVIMVASGTGLAPFRVGG